MKTQSQDLHRYAASGMAAYLPGMVYMVELMQAQLDSFRAQLTQLQATDEQELPPRAERFAAKQRKKTFWSGLSEEERSAEMMRRMAVARRKKAAKNHPRDPDHPDHAKWLVALQKAHKTTWAKKTKAERAAWAAKMRAGHEAKASGKPVVKLAMAS